ncbi:hypothetical protein FJN14_17110 [Alteromonas mediterranea]|uniref:hypothetical protein n=1 Tax=Alteromonas mediterranea TaxID=314275 RepID=UPI00113175C3|nr:hypothetical protein [Alteromonas mediterranea]QDG40083.1 hypothetical protein FJN14_17110 [Alteromonas mediterranea]
MGLTQEIERIKNDFEDCNKQLLTEEKSLIKSLKRFELISNSIKVTSLALAIFIASYSGLFQVEDQKLWSIIASSIIAVLMGLEGIFQLNSKSRNTKELLTLVCFHSEQTNAVWQSQVENSTCTHDEKLRWAEHLFSRASWTLQTVREKKIGYGINT